LESARGDLQPTHHGLRNGIRDRLDDDGKRSGVFERERVADQFLRRFFLACLLPRPAKAMDVLRRQPDVPHDREAGRREPANRICHGASTFQLHGGGTAFLSLPTHASDQCRSACRYLAAVLAALIRGEDRAVVLSPDWEPLRVLHEIKPLHPLIHEVAMGSFRDKQPPAIEGWGWVVKNLEASLWAFYNSDTFEEAVLQAVNLGDDADTTGAICGQLARGVLG
jgi:hypothetical protein